MRFVAVDWSGAVKPRNLWWCEAGNAPTPMTREQVVARAMAMRDLDPDIVIGLDFAFSYPRWFFEHRGLRDVDDLWTLAAEEGASWLQRCEPPFYGLRGTRRDGRDGFRATERALLENRYPVKSVFQIAGAGAVGTGTIRGMPFLQRLRREGFKVWPFDPPQTPLIVEIYPRLFSAVKKSDHVARFREVEALGLHPMASVSEDAFDATVSVTAMSRTWAEPVHPPHPDAAIEGWIWPPIG